MAELSTLGSTIKPTYEGEADTNAFTNVEKALLANQSGTNTGDESAASDITSGVVELATIAEVDTGTDITRAITPAGLTGSALQSKVDGIEAAADVTDTINVTAAGALMDSEVDVDLKTFSLPANTTISAFGATLVDDADAATARATLGVGAGSGDVTKVGTPANNQVGVWTGDGTLEGTAAFTFDGAALGITGDISVSGTVDGRDVATDGSKLDGIESNATADQSSAEIKSAYEANADTNAFTDSEQTLLGNQSGANTGDEAEASATVSGVVELATIAEVDTGTDTVRAVTPAGLAGSALQSKVDGIEVGADVTDTTNVTAAGALMASEVDADLKTLALPANTTISAFGATLMDDADAATARATLDAGPKYPSISAVTISASAIATELNGSNYTLVLSEDVDSGWTAAIPSGGTAATKTYYATLRISPPVSGGPFVLSIPSGWKRFGGISTISLSSTDEAILVYLRSNGASDVDFTAVQAS